MRIYFSFIHSFISVAGSRISVVRETTSCSVRSCSQIQCSPCCLILLIHDLSLSLSELFFLFMLFLCLNLYFFLSLFLNLSFFIFHSFMCVLNLVLASLFRTYLFGQIVSLFVWTPLVVITDNLVQLARGLTRFLLGIITQHF